MVFTFVGVVLPSVGVVLTSGGMVLPLWALFHLYVNGFTSLCVVFTSAGVVLR